MVHERCLTHRALGFSCGVADIVTNLGTANGSSIIVDLVRLVYDEHVLLRSAAKWTYNTGWVSIVLVNERSGVSRVGLSVNKRNRCNCEEGR